MIRFSAWGEIYLAAVRKSRRFQFKRECIDPALLLGEPVKLADYSQFVIDSTSLEQPACVRTGFRCKYVPVGCDIEFRGTLPVKLRPLAKAQPVRQLITVASPSPR